MKNFLLKLVNFFHKFISMICGPTLHHRVEIDVDKDGVADITVELNSGKSDK